MSVLTLELHREQFFPHDLGDYLDSKPPAEVLVQRLMFEELLFSFQATLPQFHLFPYLFKDEFDLIDVDF